jgi:putative membrane protein
VLFEAVVGLIAGLAAGLLPGLHPNNLAAALAPLGPMALIVSFVAQSFSAALPSVFIGAPAAGAEASVLPAHRMLLKGEAGRAVLISIVSILLSLFFFLALLWPVLIFIPEKLPSGVVIFALVFFSLTLVLFERNKLAALAFFIAAGFFGLALVSDGNLFPIFAGFFGGSTLVEGIGKRERLVARGKDENPPPISRLIFPVFIGTLCGLVVGVMPSLTVSIVAVVAASLVGGMETEEFLALSVSAGFSSFLFSIPAAIRLGVARNGTMAAALSSGWSGGMLAGTIVAIIIAAGVSAFAVRFLIRPVFTRIAGFRFLNEISLAILFLSVGIFSGLAGLAVFALALGLGLACGRAGVSKRVLMGALIAPTAGLYIFR